MSSVEKTFATKEKKMPENYHGVNVKLIPVDTKEIKDPCQLCAFKNNPPNECGDIPCTSSERDDEMNGYFTEVKK